MFRGCSFKHMLPLNSRSKKKFLKEITDSPTLAGHKGGVLTLKDLQDPPAPKCSS